MNNEPNREPAPTPSEPTPPIAPLSSPTPEIPSGPSPQTPPPSTPFIESTPRKLHPQHKLIWAALGVLVTASLVAGAYLYGSSRGYAIGKKAQESATATAELKVPANATMISRCSVGEGTQYVMPSDIPKGPIYNVWDNKVTGVGYMLSQSEITGAKTQDLALLGQKYDHVDIVYVPAGHAGFTEPHYHVIFSLTSYAEEQKITCNGQSSDMHMEH